MLEFDRVTRRFEDREVVRSFSLSVEPGERVALRGPNGSGKTTLLRCALGTLTPSDGRVTVGGHLAGSLESRQLTGVSLSQERSFYMRLTGLENLLFFARLRRGTERDVDSIVDELGLGEIAAQRADRCSSGQLQQLSIARALVGHPRVALLDEPTRSLDSDARARLWTALDRRPETAVLIATHLEEDVERCSRVVELESTA